MNETRRGVSTSELREFAAATMSKRRSQQGPIFALLAITIVAGGLYGWRTGMFNRIAGRFGEANAQAARSGGPSNPGGSQGRTSQAAATEPAKYSGYTVDDYSYGLVSQSFAEQANAGGVGILAAGVTFSHLDAIKDPADITLLRDGKANGIKEAQLRINCNRQAERRYRETTHLDGAERYVSSWGEEVYCLIATKPERLCDRSEREYLARRFRNYAENITSYARLMQSNAKKAAISEIEANERNMRGYIAALQSGVHQSIRMELRKVALSGRLQSSDFAVTPPNIVVRAFEGIVGANGCQS